MPEMSKNKSMKKIAIAGIGAIGSIVGSHLAASGRDVLLIEPFWREHAEAMKKNGLVLADAVESTGYRSMSCSRMN